MFFFKKKKKESRFVCVCVRAHAWMYTHARSGPHSCLCMNMKGTRVFWVSSVAFLSIPLRQSLSEPGTLGVCRLVANQQISASPFVSTLSELESYSISMIYEYEYA